jgi:glycine oxidase
MSQSVVQCDVAVIGGGVIGCAIAWRLGQAGMRVIVIERGQPGAEASHAAGGMLVPQAEADRADDFFQLGVKSRAMYADFARELREATGIDVEYRTEGTLYLALTDEDEAELDRRWQWQREAGLNVKRLSADCARKLEPQVNDRLRWALKFPDDHQVDNRRLMLALAAAAQSVGAEFQTNTEAIRLLTESQAGHRHVTGIETTKGEVQAGAIVLAAGSWSSLLTDERGNSVTGFRIKPVRGQMIAIENPTPPLRHIIYSCRGYLVPRLSGCVITGSTTEYVGYDKSVTAGGVASIIERAVEIAPALRSQPIREMWAGLRPKGRDNMPVLGADPNFSNLIYATAHYRNGILLTPITARAISEIICGGESSYNLTPFSVTRFASRSVAG